MSPPCTDWPWISALSSWQAGEWRKLQPKRSEAVVRGAPAGPVSVFRSPDSAGKSSIMRTVLAGNEAGTLHATCHQRRGPFMG